MAKRLRLPAATLNDTRGFVRRASPLFIVRSRANGLGHPRFSVIVSIKVDRRSTERHRLKRRVSGYLRLKQRTGDFIITVLPPAKSLSRPAFLQEIDRLLS